MAERRTDLDALRGLLLVLMTLTHLPTRLSEITGQPFGFVSAAEGFVMVSGFMAGMVYSARARRDGDPAMQEAFFKRALKIYACQAALLLFAFTVIAVLGLVARQEAVTGLLGFYLEDPLTALVSSLLLVYNPSLLDILPIYIVFMLVSPLLIVHGRRHGWGVILAGSVLLWLAAQFGLGPAVHAALAESVGLPVRYQDTGAFEIFAWQFLWVLGLWLGASQATDAPVSRPFPRWVVGVAIVLAVIGMVWRQVGGQTPFPGDATLNLLFDKWRVGPLRLISFFALMVVAMRFGPGLLRRLPRLRPLELLGQASLPVFCAHLVVALTALAIWGAPQSGRPWSIDVAIVVGGFAVLLAVAQTSAVLDRRAAAAMARVRARRAARINASGGLRSPPATAHNPPR